MKWDISDIRFQMSAASVLFALPHCLAVLLWGKPAAMEPPYGEAHMARNWPRASDDLRRVSNHWVNMVADLSPNGPWDDYSLQHLWENLNHSHLDSWPIEGTKFWGHLLHSNTYLIQHINWSQFRHMPKKFWYLEEIVFCVLSGNIPIKYLCTSDTRIKS